MAGEQKKGSDSAINNGGMRPGLVGASPTATDIEMTAGELAAEDEEAAIEERCGPVPAQPLRASIMTCCLSLWDQDASVHCKACPASDVSSLHWTPRV